MPPKKASAAAPAKKASTAGHPSYKDMIKDAIVSLKERTGSSRQAIKKYINANHKLGNTTENQLSQHISAALASGVKSGEFEMPKGKSGPVKLAKKSAAAAPAKKTAAAEKPATTKKAAAPKTAAKKSAATAPKKSAAATKKTTTATKSKAAAKPKANTAKPRKAAPKKTSAAPAVEDVKPVVLGKTKSGRVTKTTAKPADKPKSRAKAAPKKAAPKKAAAKKA